MNALSKTQPHEGIVLLAPEGAGHEVAVHLTGRGRPVIAERSWDRVLERIEALRPSVVLVALPLAEGIEAVRARAPEILTVVMAPRKDMDRALAAFTDTADDFLPLPAPAWAVEIVLRRGAQKGRLHRQLQSVRESMETLALKRTAQKVETARYVTVKQIVDQLSTFIGRIAAQAQGGLKFFDEMPFFVSIHDRSARVVAANRTHKKHFGNQIGANSWEIYRGKFSGPATCPVSRTIATGNVQTFRAAVEYQSGNRVPIIVHTAPIFNNEGETALVLEVAGGSREIRRMAEEIRSTQQRYQKLFDNAPSFIAVLDPRSRIIAVNRRFRESFGENIGRFFNDVLKHQCMPSFQCPIRMTLEDAQPHHAEMMLSDEAGRSFSTLIWTSPIFSATQKLTSVIVILADVSEQRKLQDNLSTLGLMIGSISHGLKGTLTGLHAGLYLIETGFYRNLPARIEEGLDAAKLMTEHVRKMVADILYYSKERDLEWQSVDAARFASEVAATVETRIRAADIAFSCDFDTGAGTMEMDAGLIRSALVNILENAMEACIEDSDGETHRIAFRVWAEKDDVFFEVRDNGAGMEDEEMKNMFTLFYSSKGSRGTGLGLYITDKVVQKHSGEIFVDSDLGRGSRFTIRLPRNPAGARKDDCKAF